MMKTDLKATAGRSDVYHQVRIVGDGELNRLLDQTGEVLLEMSDIVPVELFHADTQVDFRSCRTFQCPSNRKWMTNASINLYSIIENQVLRTKSIFNGLPVKMANG